MQMPLIRSEGHRYKGILLSIVRVVANTAVYLEIRKLGEIIGLMVHAET
jgi:hypothetical protein